MVHIPSLALQVRNVKEMDSCLAVPQPWDTPCLSGFPWPCVDPLERGPSFALFYILSTLKDHSFAWFVA